MVIDGQSEDSTREIVRRYSDKYSFVKILDNQKKIVPAALNMGIRNSKGDVILRMDSHNVYEKDYITKCVKYLMEYDIENVGGVCVTLPGAETVVARCIALALSQPFGVGNSQFRIGLKEPKYVDTVPFGCFKKRSF